MYKRSAVYVTKGKKTVLGLLSSRELFPRVQTLILRHASVSSSDAKPKKISDNISFRAAYDSPYTEAHKRPIVLLYGWLVAKARHIHKYGDFYLGKGFDVIHVKLKPDQFLRPVQAQKVVDDVLNFINEGDRQKQPIVQHGFSVGAYLYGETLVKIKDNIETYGNVGERMRGQILDSPVEFYRVPYGVSKAVTKVPALQNLIESSLNAYLKAFYQSTTRHYIRAQEVYLENQFSIPTLYMYSHADIIADPLAIEENVIKMEREGLHVESVCFEGSGHVSHFHRHPVQYITALQTFLANIGLLQDVDAKAGMKVSN